MRLIPLLLPLILLMGFIQDGDAQTCCSAGAPILSALEVNTTAAGQWQIGFQYDYNDIRDVYSQSTKIEGLRRRVTQTGLLDVSFGLNTHWAFTALFSWVQHHRRLNRKNINGSIEGLSVRGSGDVLLMTKYTILPLDIINQRQLAVGLGVKIPLGKSDLRQNDILLSADMQPGTGSWDYAGWLFFSQGFRGAVPFVLFLNTSFRLNGTNNRFQVDDARFNSYRFGNVLSVTAGAAYNASELVDISLRLQVRKTVRDEFAGSAIPNTGGTWVYASPGINFNIKPFTWRASVRLPLYRQLNEIQLSTSYVVSTGLIYTIE